MIKFDVSNRVMVWNQHEINIMKQIPFVIGKSCGCNRIKHTESEAKEHQHQHAIQKINVIVNKEFTDNKNQITLVDMFEDSVDSFDTEDVFLEIA